jgi:hypothetical protein
VTVKTAYKTIPPGMASHGHKWKIGQWYHHEGDLRLCRAGFHASKLLPDCFEYVTPGSVCKVEYKGRVIECGDKFVSESMRVVWAVRWTKKDSLRFLLSLREGVEKINPDVRVRACFDAVEKVLSCDTKKNRAPAGAAAWAARAAAWAANDAARAASDAARAAAKRRQHKTILSICNNKRKEAEQ